MSNNQTERIGETQSQQEFTETDESLQIIDNLADRGSQTNRASGGQNLFNVYQLRSYSAEVEMLGNAMVQPMMYFQLNNSLNFLRR